MAKYGLVCPFLTDDPVYAHGVEFGLLYAQMQHSGEKIIEDYFTIENQEQITLLANRLGWRIAKMKPWRKQWVLFRLEK